MSTENYPLDGLKVLDLSRVLAGPFAGRMLSDLGADVVKIEPPDGDITRLWGRVIAGISGYYQQQNAGKRNICIDLRAEGAKELLYELVAESDILIENYRPDVMPRLGLGYDTLKAINPRLIMLSISGFGHSGPESHRAAYAPIIHAEAGLTYRQAERSDLPYSELPLSVADTNASLHGLVGLLSAVIHRHKTEVGQHIDIAMLDATVATDDQIHFDLENANGSNQPRIATWETGAGPILVSADARYFWYCLSRNGLVADPTNKDMSVEEKIPLRKNCMAAFMAALSSLEEVESTMASMNLAWGRVGNPAEIQDQQTMRSRRSIVEIDDRAGGTRPVTQSPYRFSTAKSGVRGPAPHRGEHNNEVLTEWLNKSGSEIEALKQAAVLHTE
jgi:CoA:oxalate CoA-transferase